MRDVYIIGVGQSKFARQPEIDGIDLGVIAAQAAIEDAGIDPRAFQVAYAGRIEEASTTAEDVLRHLGVKQIECHNCENACATGGSAVRMLWKDIAYGIFDLGIAIGLESLSTSPIGNGMVPTANTSILNQLGFPAAGETALMCQYLTDTRGANMEDFARASYRSKINALYNPYAHIKKKFSMEDIINSEMIASPITKYMCCPMSDGAAAIIMCTKEIAYQYTNNPVKVVTCEFSTGDFLSFEDDFVTTHQVKVLAKRCYELSGISPEDVDVVETHDAFSPADLAMYENLLFCPEGDCVKYQRDGGGAKGGKQPCNMSGGLLSLGHPLGASGVRVMVDVVKQLRGDCPVEVQIEGADCGLAEMNGGQLQGRTKSEANFISLLTV